MSALVPSSLDLGGPGNLDRARYELHRAIDFGTAEEQAAWAAKWGEAFITRTVEVGEIDWDDDHLNVTWVNARLKDVNTDIRQARSALAAAVPDKAEIEARLSDALREIESLQTFFEGE